MTVSSPQAYFRNVPFLFARRLAISQAGIAARTLTSMQDSEEKE